MQISKVVTKRKFYLSTQVAAELGFEFWYVTCIHSFIQQVFSEEHCVQAPVVSWDGVVNKTDQVSTPIKLTP